MSTLPQTAKAITFIVTRDREAAKRFYGGILGSWDGTSLTS